MKTCFITNAFIFLALIFVSSQQIACEEKSDDQNLNFTNLGFFPSIPTYCIQVPTAKETVNQTDEELANFYLNSANLVYDDYEQCRDGDRVLLKEESKKLYKRAAEYGNLEAHYLLTYLFIPESRESEIEHLQFAASRGHLKALESLSESLVFRCDSLDYFDPQLLLDTFDDALQYHPVLNEEIANYDPESSQFDYQLPGRYKWIEMCCELLHGLDPFDAQTFRDTYGITKEEENEIYGIWLMAEQASMQDGRFGELNQTLVYQLVLRGGWVPMEYGGALQDMYAAWQTGESFNFNICNYMTSGAAASLCASRSTIRCIETYQDKMESIANSVEGTLKDNVQLASSKYLEFTEQKVYNEEFHDGSWRSIWAYYSLSDQLDSFVELLQSVRNATYKLELSSDYKTIDNELNSIYKKYISLSMKNEYTEVESVRAIQRLWILHRDSTAECLHELNSNISIVEWKTWLTEMRVSQLVEAIFIIESRFSA